MTLLLSNEDVERALTHADALFATEQILRELANGQAINRPRSQTYLPVESRSCRTVCFRRRASRR